MMRSALSSSPGSVARLARGGCCMLARGHRPSGCVGGDVSAVVRHTLLGAAMNLTAEGALCCCWRWCPPSPCHPSGRLTVAVPRSALATSWPSPRSARREQGHSCCSWRDTSSLSIPLTGLDRCL
jgi:hypothetical protein